MNAPSKTILAAHAHPDDIEILAAGTLALLGARGHKIVMLTMTPGDCGSHERGPEDIAAIRREEAARSAARIGAEYHCAEFRDMAVFSDDPSRRRIVEILRTLRPDIVLAASPADYMADHEAASLLVRDACFAAPAPNYFTRARNAAPALPTIPHLYYMDPIAATAADFYVNIGGAFTTKREMLAEHQSQRSWLAKHHGVDNYLEQMEQWTRDAGRRAGVEFAEGFRQHAGHAYPDTPALQELLQPHIRAAA